MIKHQHDKVHTEQLNALLKVTLDMCEHGVGSGLTPAESLRLTIVARQKAVKALIDGGMSQRETAKTLGVHKKTVERDLGKGKPKPKAAPNAPPEAEKDQGNQSGSALFAPEAKGDLSEATPKVSEATKPLVASKKEESSTLSIMQFSNYANESDIAAEKALKILGQQNLKAIPSDSYDGMVLEAMNAANGWLAVVKELRGKNMDKGGHLSIVTEGNKQ